MGQKIIVIGAGIIGAVSAYQLQKSGAEVTILDAGAASATDQSFGWINASFFENDDHFRLRADGIKAYRDLARDLDLPINWCGCLCWEETGDAFDAQYQSLKSLGYGVEIIDRGQFSKLEPHVPNPPDRCLWFRGEGAVDSGALSRAVTRAACVEGARVINGVHVHRIVPQGTGIHLETDVGLFRADQVLVAAGTGTQDLMSGLGVNLPMLHRPALMLQTRPVAVPFNHVLVSEIGELRQLDDGSLLMPAAINHQADTSDHLGGSPDHVADGALARLQAMLPQLDLSWSHGSVAYRPIPADGLPVIGAVRDGVTVATLHSGISLGAVVGQMVAAEMLGDPNPRLEPYRHTRFAS